MKVAVRILVVVAIAAVIFSITKKEAIDVNWTWVKTIEEAVSKAPKDKTAGFVSPMPQRDYNNTREISKALKETEVQADAFFITAESFATEDILALVSKECTMKTNYSLTKQESKGRDSGFGFFGIKTIITREFCSGDKILTIQESTVPWGKIYTIAYR